MLSVKPLRKTPGAVRARGVCTKRVSTNATHVTTWLNSNPTPPQKLLICAFYHSLLHSIVEARRIPNASSLKSSAPGELSPKPRRSRFSESESIIDFQQEIISRIYGKSGRRWRVLCFCGIFSHRNIPAQTGLGVERNRNRNTDKKAITCWTDMEILLWIWRRMFALGKWAALMFDVKKKNPPSLNRSN